MGNPIVRYEAGQTAYPFEAAANAGDNTTFAASFSPISAVAGAEPVVAPYGLLTGGAITVHATNNTINVAALTASMAAATGADAAGVISVAAATPTITRPATAVAKVCSVTVTNAGAIAVVAGTDGASTTFSEVRGAAGGRPSFRWTASRLARCVSPPAWLQPSLPGKSTVCRACTWSAQTIPCTRWTMRWARSTLRPACP